MFTLEHLAERCPVCKQPHGKNWKPQFWKEKHYKTTTCGGCGYKIFFSTPEIHSGHY